MGGRFLAISRNQLGQGKKQRGLRQAIAFDAVVLCLRPRLLQITESQPLLFVISHVASCRMDWRRNSHCN